MTTGEDIKNVADRRACRAGHDTDASWCLGKRLLAFLREPSCLVELHFELFELKKELADSRIAELSDEKLVVATWGVDTELPADDHLIAIFWRMA